MEIMEELIKGENEAEAIIEGEEPDPSDIGDRQYKEWLESQYLKELENSRKKRMELLCHR